MKSASRLIAIGLLLALPLAAPATAQYIYMDNNTGGGGDGLNGQPEPMELTGPTTVDVYLDFSANRDGGGVVCPQNSNPYDCFSYEVTMEVTGGSAAFGTWTNSVANWNSLQAQFNDGTHLHVFFGTSNPTDFLTTTGPVKLGSIPVNSCGDAVTLSFVPNIPSVGGTSFGSSCPGSLGLNTIFLGSDFTDNDGMQQSPGGGTHPTITAPANVTANEGAATTISISATDPNGDPITFTPATGQPASLVFSSGATTAQVSGTLTFTDANGPGTALPCGPRVYSITWFAGDGVVGQACAQTNLTVNNVNRVPTLAVPAARTVAELTVIPNSTAAGNMTATATDLDGGASVTIATPTGITLGPCPGTGLTFAQLAGSGTTRQARLSGTITQNAGDSNPTNYSIVWSVSDNCGGSAAATQSLQVTNVNRTPSITASANATLTEGDAVNLSATGTDADFGDALTLAQTGMPTGLTFNGNSASTPGTCSTSQTKSASITGQLSPTSGDGNPSVYNIAWSVNDGAGGSASATTVLTVNNSAAGNLAPIITVPGNLTQNEGTPVSLTATSTDADAGDAITMTQAGKPASLTFTPSNGNPASAAITGTLSFADAAGSPYSIVWTATDNGTPNLTASGTTALTVNNVNQAPVITVPANLTQNEGTAVNLTANATDGDAANTITMTQAGKPASLTFTATNGNPASATITGTLNFTDSAGSPYNIVWTATDNGTPVLSASGTTVLTVNNSNRAPVITVPANLTRVEGDAVSITATATDADGTDLISMTQAGKPASLAFAPTNGNPASATVSGTLAAGSSSGSPYNIVWTATDNGSPNMSASGTTVLTVNAPANLAPIITVPANLTQNEGTAVSLTANATDGDAANTITMTQTGKPASLTFTATNGNPASATITGTLNFTDSASSQYNIVWTATDNGSPNLSASDVTVLQVNNVNRAPVITVPANLTRVEGDAVSITATATDADGTDLISMTQAGKPASLAFAPTNGNPASATISGTLAAGSSSGSPYNIVWTATDNGSPSLSASGTTVLTVNAPANQNPTITASANATQNEGTAVNLSANASDPDAANVVSITQTGKPASLTFTPTNGNPASAAITGTLNFTDSVGSPYNIVWTANDGAGGTASATTVLTVNNANQAPVITVPANLTRQEGLAVSITATATDADAGDTITMTQAGKPASLTFTPANGNPASATISGTLAAGDATGSPYNIVWTATDNGSPNLSASGTTVLTVNTVPNTPPGITASANATQNEGTAVSLSANATDADAAQTLTIAQTGKPASLTFTPTNGNPASATITGTLNFTDSAGSPYSIVWTVNDGAGGTAAATTVLTVNNVNRAPVITVPADLTRSVGQVVDITATATDADAGDTITMTQTGKPASFSFTAANGNPASATISGTLAAGDETGSPYSIVWTATDNGSPNMSASGTTVLTVGAQPNADPIITASADATHDEGTAVSLSATATDSDVPAQALTITQTGKPASLTFTAINGGPPASATITGTLSFTDGALSPYSIVWTVIDGHGGTASATTVLTVNEVNRAPVITVPANLTQNEGTAVSLTANATDVDAGDTIAMTQAGKPASLTFTPSNGNPASATITGTLSFTDAAGSPYSIVWTATDNGSPNMSASGTTVLTVDNVNQAPVITVPANLTRNEGQAVSITATATDGDAGDTITMTETGEPASLAFTASNGNPASGTLSGTLAAGESSGSPYNIVWTATDNGSPNVSASGTTVLTVGTQANQDPTITASANATHDEGTNVSLSANASDPDAADVVSITQTGKPASLAFLATDGNPASATITGPLSFTDAAGSPYSIVWTASDGRGGTASATTVLTVNNVNQTPVITVPANLTRSEGDAVSITATATDADAGDTITMTQTGKPASLTFTPTNGNPAAATLAGTLAAGESSGSPYSIVWTATDDGSPNLSASGTTVLTVNAQPNQAPTITASADATQDEGTAVSLSANASDPDAADVLTMTQTGKPASLTFTPTNGNPASATITGTLSFTDATGSPYTIVWTADDGHGGTASATTVLTVNDVNRAPVSQPGGPYQGVVGVALTFSGNTSFDPDGDAITYEWDFDATDGITIDSTAEFPSHTYGLPGSYTVTLTVKDPALLSNTETTTAEISDRFAADCFTTGGNKTIRLRSGKQFWCLQIQPHLDSYTNSNVMLNTIQMSFGTATPIPAATDKTVLDSDRNHDGIQEITACFSKTDLQALFASLENGKQTVTVTVAGDLASGGSFECTTEVDVVKAGGVVVSASPNPLNPETEIEFVLTQAGQASVRIYDLNGRLVKSLVDQSMPVGAHTARWDGTDAAGRKVGSGVYYVAVEGRNERAIARLVVLK